MNSAETSRQASPETGAQAQRVERTRAKISAAVVACLDELGYSETSIMRVQERAGVSRGALTHHFPSKEAMMVETIKRVLDPVRGTPGPESALRQALARAPGEGDDAARDLKRLWRKVIDTAQGRALVEILVAARTDTGLQARISPHLTRYNDEFGQNIRALYASTSGNDDDITLLWAICRTFLRGLHTHAQFASSHSEIDAMIERFAELIAPHMTNRPPLQETP